MPGTMARASPSKSWTAPACTDGSKPSPPWWPPPPASCRVGGRGRSIARGPGPAPCAEQAGAGRGAQPDDVALHRADRRQPGPFRPPICGVPAPAATRTRSPTRRARRRLTAGPAPRGHHPRPSTPRRGRPRPARPAGPGCRRGGPRHLDTAADRGGQGGHQPTALAWPSPVRRAAQRVLEGEELVEHGAVRGVDRHDEGAGRSSRCRPGVVLELGGEVFQRAAPASTDRSPPPRRMRLGDRGQHPGGHPRGAVPARGGSDHRHPSPPGQRQAAESPMTPPPTTRTCSPRAQPRRAGRVFCTFHFWASVVPVDPSPQSRKDDDGHPASTTPRTSTTPAASAWWPTCTAGPTTTSSTGA